MIKTLQIDAFIVKASYVFCNSPEMLSCQQIDYLLSRSRFVKKLWCFVGAGHFKIFGVILNRNSDWLGTYSQHTYHVEFKVWLVSKPLVSVTSWNFCKVREKCLLSQSFLKMYIKTDNDFAFPMISWTVKPCVCFKCLSLRLRQITQTSALW